MIENNSYNKSEFGDVKNKKLKPSPLQGYRGNDGLAQLRKRWRLSTDSRQKNPSYF